jgi:hypothetical protein
VLSVGCGETIPTPTFRTAYGTEVYVEDGALVDGALVDAAQEGIIAGVRFVYGDASSEQVQNFFETVVYITALPGYVMKCRNATENVALGCTSGFRAQYVTDMPYKCAEVILAHELSHVAGWILGEEMGHMNEKLFGPMSVAFLGEGRVRTFCQGGL